MSLPVSNNRVIVTFKNTGDIYSSGLKMNGDAMVVSNGAHANYSNGLSVDANGGVRVNLTNVPVTTTTSGGLPFDSTGRMVINEASVVNYSNGVPFDINGAVSALVVTTAYGYDMVASGDYFSTPNAVANQITGNLSLVVEVALNDYTPAVIETLVAKDSVSAGGRSYAFNLQTDGKLRLNYSLTGSAIISVTASTPLTLANNTRCHLAVEREASTGKVRFYQSLDGSVTWTQIGTEQTGTSGNIFAGNAVVQFGNLSSLSYALNGKIYDSEGYAGLQITSPTTSVMKYDFDPGEWVSGTTWTSSETGEVWTINGNAKVQP